MFATLYDRASHWFCRNYPQLTGAHSYHGTLVYFPRGSYSSRVLRSQGAFEPDNARLLQGLVTPDTWLFDVGTNIGLMSVPVLAGVANSRVLSFEPSPNVLPFLRRTMGESPYGERWLLTPKAVGSEEGTVMFNLSDQGNSEFDGVEHTGRVPSVRTVTVEMTTIDREWRRHGSPRVSIIKCDVEGAELDVLRGARACLESTRPFVLLEWNRQNFRAYDVTTEELLEFVTEVGFSVLAVPTLVKIESVREFELQMIGTENFLLFPDYDGRLLYNHSSLIDEKTVSQTK